MTTDTKNPVGSNHSVLKSLIFIANQKGGSGKTTTADSVASILRLGNLVTLVVDVDGGNSGFIRRCGARSAISLQWDTGADQVDQWCERHLPGVEAVVFDIGANFLAASPPASGFLSVVMDKAEDSAAIVKVLAVASPNAPGTGRLVQNLRDMFGAATILIKNDTDGTSNFAKSLATRNVPTANLGHLEPGIMAARLSHEMALDAFISAPPEGHTLAAAILAEQLLRFAQEEALAELIPSDAIAALQIHAANAPGKTHMHIACAGYATDAALRLNAKLADECRKLRHDALADSSHAAHAFFVLEQRFNELP